MLSLVLLCAIDNTAVMLRGNFFIGHAVVCTYIEIVFLTSCVSIFKKVQHWLVGRLAGQTVSALCSKKLLC